MALRTKVKMLGSNALSLASTDTFYSEPLDLSNSRAGSFQLSWTGATPNATETVWASNHPDPDLSTDDDWIDVTATFAAVNVTGNSGSGFVNFPAADHVYGKYRLKFVNVSGTATVEIHGVGITQTN